MNIKKLTLFPKTDSTETKETKEATKNKTGLKVKTNIKAGPAVEVCG